MLDLFLRFIGLGKFKNDDENKEYSKNTKIIKCDDVYNNPPYTFSILVKCERELTKPYIIEFNPNSPFEICLHKCEYCKKDISITANDVYKGYDERDISFSGDLTLYDMTYHDISDIMVCDKIKKDDFKAHYNLEK